MTCKDCIHEDLCGTFTRPCMPDEANASERLCKDFKNKADFVEVVRCKDCKYRKKDKLFVSGHYCYLRPVNGGRFCEDDGFCSYGKRKQKNDFKE